MGYGRVFSTKRLQRYCFCNFLSGPPLVGVILIFFTIAQYFLIGFGGNKESNKMHVDHTVYKKQTRADCHHSFSHIKHRGRTTIVLYR